MAKRNEKLGPGISTRAAGRMGGIARAKNMTKEERSAYGRLLAQKRWEKAEDELKG